MYRDMSLESYLKDAASATPTPGGGSVAALVGALATAMSSMSARFTMGKEISKRGGSHIKKILAGCEKSREILLSLVEEDCAVYDEVNKAFGMPKVTQSEMKLRSDAIQRATINAMEVPLKTTMCCLYVLELTRELVDIVNANLISEVGVACFLAEAALQCAKLNVDINLASVKNQNLVEKVQKELGHTEKKAKVFFKEIQTCVQGKIKK